MLVQTKALGTKMVLPARGLPARQAVTAHLQLGCARVCGREKLYRMPQFVILSYAQQQPFSGRQTYLDAGIHPKGTSGWKSVGRIASQQHRPHLYHAEQQSALASSSMVPLGICKGQHWATTSWSFCAGAAFLSWVSIIAPASMRHCDRLDSRLWGP